MLQEFVAAVGADVLSIEALASGLPQNQRLLSW
jgi:hypothetical protein